MIKRENAILTLIFFLTFSLCFPNLILSGEDEEKERAAMTTVTSVDLQKYAGVWYEIARIPNSFQKNCTQNTTATYRMREDGRVDVINRCIDADGDTIEAKGIARIVDTETRSKLEVSFVRLLGFNLFWGDYWILGLADDYRYAVVGEPSRKYGWILSRKPSLTGEDFDTIQSLLKTQGYNPDNFLTSTNNY